MQIRHNIKYYLLLVALILAGQCVFGQTVDTTGGFISIYNDSLKNPICNYEILTKAHLKYAVQQNRDTIQFYPENLNKLYSHSGYSRGHALPFEDFAYSPATAKACMNIARNIVPEPQAQNIGTELASENLERGLAEKYDSVQVYVGAYESSGSVKEINVPAGYWKVIITGVDTLCYLMSFTGPFIHYGDLISCQVQYKNVVAVAGFDPVDRIKQILK